MNIQHNATIKISKGEAETDKGKIKIVNLTVRVHNTSEISGTKLGE